MSRWVIGSRMTHDDHDHDVSRSDSGACAAAGARRDVAIGTTPEGLSVLREARLAFKFKFRVVETRILATHRQLFC